MATITSLPSGTPFMGNPITLTASPGAISGASFHRVLLIVNIGGTEFPLSQPVSEGVTSVEFDISSCFRSMVEKYEYAPLTSGSVTYPRFDATLSIGDSYVKDGQSYGRDHVTPNAASYSAYMGRLTDYELRVGNIPSQPSLTLKPTDTPELVCLGDTFVYGHWSSSPVSTAVTVSLPNQATSGPFSAGGRTAYVVPVQRHSLQFQFVNSRGVVESIRAWGLPSEKAVSSQTLHTYSVFERINRFSRTLPVNTVKPSEFVLSSGFVTRSWAQWWAYEFCTARRHWVFYDGHWLPCIIKLDESTTVFDATKTELPHIDFTWQPDLNGPLL